jgi:glycosyltransferase involved in cell wall biosynthesis
VPASQHTVAHILPYTAVGGTEHATLRIAKAVDASRFPSIAFCLRNAPSVRAHFESAGIPCVLYDPPEPSYRHARTFLRASRELSRQLTNAGASVVHCADLSAASHAALGGRLAGIPVICHIRNRFFRISRRDRSFLWPVRRFVFVSANTWQNFGHQVNRRRGIVVYDGLDVPANQPDGCHGVRREFGIPAEAPIVGMMARVAPQKDFATLARAAATVLHAFPRTRFLIVGDFSSTDTYRQHYCEVRAMMQSCGVADAFIFTDHREDVPRLMHAIDVFVLSTHWEGLPLVILEAMAHEKPVIATAVDGIPEVVTNGKTGLLFPHEDHETLTRHIVGVLSDPDWAAELAAAGRRLVTTRFSREQFGASMNAVYASVLGV